MFGHQGILFFIDSFGFLDLASRDSYALVWICGEECVIFVFLGRTCCYVILQEHPRNRRFHVVGCLDNVEIGRAHSELQSLMRISYAVFCLKKKKTNNNITYNQKYIRHYNTNQPPIYKVQTNILT